MKKLIGKQLIPVWGLAAIVLAIIVVGSATGGHSLSKNAAPQQKEVKTIPPIVSKVKSLEILVVEVIDQDTPAPRLAITLKNKSHKAIMQVDLVSGEAGLTRNGLTDEENPIVVIEPHGTATIDWSMRELTYGAPLVVSAVVFDDGTEEGDADSLEIMRKIRAHDKKMVKEEKEKKGGPRQ